MAEEEKPAAPALQALVTQEIAAIARDPFVPAWQETLDNDDPTLRARAGGKGIGLYDEIKRDPQAYAVLQKRTLAVTTREWQVEAASDRRIDKKAAELVEQQLDNIAFDRVTAGLMGAVLKGYAVGEVMWSHDGTFWQADRVRIRKQRRFRFTPDGELRLITRENQSNGVPVPGRKFIVQRYSLDHDDDSPYGEGLGSVLYWPAWFKRQALAHWLQSLERNAEPTKHVTYPGDWDEAKQKKLTAELIALRRAGILVTPEGVEAELLEAKATGGAAAFEAIERYLDEMMSVAVLGESLSTNAGENGSRALGEVHQDVRLAIAKADADLICDTINESLVTWITEVNYPGAEPPAVWRNFDEPEDLDKRAVRDKALHDMGYEYADIEQINETYGGEWVKKAAPAPEKFPLAPGIVPKPGALPSATAAFAEADPEVPEVLADQLGGMTEAPVGVWIEQIRGAFAEATSYDDLALRLARLAPELAIDDVARAIGDALTVADLSGRAEVADGS